MVGFSYSLSVSTIFRAFVLAELNRDPSEVDNSVEFIVALLGPRPVISWIRNPDFSGNLNSILMDSPR
jgi:hypothetical protein